MGGDVVIKSLHSALSWHGFFRGSSKHAFTISDLDKLAREKDDESIIDGGKIRTIVANVS